VHPQHGGAACPNMTQACNTQACPIFPTLAGYMQATVHNRAQADAMFTWSKVFYRTCPDCGSTHHIIFYKRISTTMGAFSVTSNMFDTWSRAQNVLNQDFELYGSEADMNAGVNKWQFCNYDDNNEKVAFPRDCGVSGLVGGQWSGTLRHDGQQDVKFYVKTVPPVACVVTNWTACSLPCGNGTRSRSITVPSQYNGTACPNLMEVCNTQACPIDCAMSNWGNCSHPCGGGTHSRSITVHPQHGGLACPPDLMEPCNAQACPIACEVSTNWTACSLPCGGGNRTRSVTVHPQHGGAKCPHLTEACNTQACPIACSVSDWGGCSKTCGHGTQNRSITVHPQYGGLACPPLTQDCNTQPCPIACEVSTNWTACSATCGGGTQSRSITVHPQHGGSACPALTDACNTQLCPINCVVSTFGACNKTCGGGTQSRSITVQPQHGGAACPHLEEACNTQHCPIECAVSGWGNCSLPCDGGQQSRSITVHPQYGGQDCPVLTQACNTQACPIDCLLSGWGACSTTCGTGNQSRSITVHPQHGGKGCEPLTQACNVQACPPVANLLGLRKFELVNFPSHFVRHENSVSYRVKISTLNTNSTFDTLDSTWRMVAGLTGAAGSVSFESTGYPGWYLRHRGSEIWLDLFNGSALNKQDATFMLRAGNSGAGLSFESVNNQSHFLRHAGPVLLLQLKDGSASFNQDSSFTSIVVAQASLPTLPALPAGITDLECWNDDGARTLKGPPQMDGFTVAACAQKAQTLGVDIFALQHGNGNTGWCATHDAQSNYQRLGKSIKQGVMCTSGGAVMTNHVYRTAVPCQVSWGACNQTCGGGTQTHTVTVHPLHGGAECPALTRACNTQHCPIDCAMSNWTYCSTTCGGGTQSRSITVPPQYGGVDCQNLTQACNTQSCPIDCAFSNWGNCSLPCGSGTQNRSITMHPQHGGAVCPPLTQACNTQSCPIPCAVSNWTACSATCGGGTQNRSITVHPQHGGSACPALTEACNTQPCPIACVVSNWTECSLSCGGGTQNRSITVHPQHGGAVCPNMTQTCNTQPCPIACAVSIWTVCSKTCGGGTQNRSITVHPQHGGAACPNMTQACNTQACPVFPTLAGFMHATVSNRAQVDAMFAWSRVFYRTCPECDDAHHIIFYKRISAMGAFSVASNMFDTWSSAQNKLHQDFELYGSEADMNAGVNKWQFCNYDADKVAFPRDCGISGPVAGQWSGVGGQQNVKFYVKTVPPVACVVSNWTACSLPCGNGTRSRSITVPSQYNGTACPDLTEACNTHACPINCAVSNWGNCSLPCGSGTQNRSIIVHPQHGGADCLPLSEVCNAQHCPIACAVSNWTACSKECGGGTQNRSITVQPQHGGADCPALTQTCNTQPCPIACVASNWTACSLPCGGGTQNRSITVQPQHGGANCSNLTQACNIQPCPINCVVSTFGACSKTCGGGTQYRRITVHPEHGGLDCLPLSEVCNTQACPPVADLMGLRKFRSVDISTQFVRHENLRVKISTLNSGSTFDTLDSTWKMVPGLTGAAGSVSFESTGYTGWYLRHRGFEVWLDKFDGSDLNKQDATFMLRAGNSGAGLSFESVNTTNHFLRHMGSVFWLHSKDGSDLFNNESSFTSIIVAQASLPTLPALPANVTDLECWNDNSARTLKVQIKEPEYGWSVATCAEKAKKSGVAIFALQNGNGDTGQCFTHDALSNYSRLGKSHKQGVMCTAGGTAWVNHVYQTSVPCQVSDFGACNQTCGGGIQTRTVTHHPLHGGAACPALSQACNTQPCPIACEVSQNWTACSLPCGGGNRSRSVTVHAQHGGADCPHLTEACNTQPCPIPCVFFQLDRMLPAMWQWHTVPLDCRTGAV